MYKGVQFSYTTIQHILSFTSTLLPIISKVLQAVHHYNIYKKKHVTWLWALLSSEGSLLRFFVLRNACLAFICYFTTLFNTFVVILRL